MTTGLLATTITLPLQEAPKCRTHYSPQLFSSKHHLAFSSSSLCLSSIVNNNRRQPVRNFSISMCLPSFSNSSSSPTKLYVSGLSFRTTKESLTNAFQQFGQLIEGGVVNDKCIPNVPRMILRLPSLHPYLSPPHPPLKPSTLLPPPSCSLPSPTTTTTTSPGLQFRRKLLYLESLNVDSLKALRLNPNFRSSPLHTLKSVETCLSSMGLPRSSLGRIFDMYPQLLTADPHLHLYPVFDFLLNDVVLPFPHISRAVNRCPRLLVSNVDTQLRPALSFLRKLGFVGRHRVDCHTTVLLVSNVEHTLVPKIEFLEGLGFEKGEVENMVVRSPGLLTYSVEKNLRPKVEYFDKEMKGDLKEIRRFPQYFSFSLEGRIKPRHRMLVEHGVEMPLAEMLKVSDGEFNVRLLEMRFRLVD